MHRQVATQHKHTADETFTTLSLKYYPDSGASSPSSSSFPPPHLMCLKKRKHTHFFRAGLRKENIYQNISPAARIDLADLLGSRPLGFHLRLLCFSPLLCSALSKQSYAHRQTCTFRPPHHPKTSPFHSK